MFLRPFTKDVWAFIIATMGTAVACYVCVFAAKGRRSVSNAEQILSNTLWFCFVLLYAYYSGALVMYFASKNAISFKERATSL